MSFDDNGNVTGISSEDNGRFTLVPGENNQYEVMPNDGRHAWHDDNLFENVELANEDNIELVHNPYITVDNDGNVISTEESESRRVFSTTTSEIVQKSMSDVIWLGTGYEAKVEGINEGGKTGTSTGEGGGTNHGWFAGYFEYNGQKYTLVVVAPNIGETHPDGRELGGGNTGAPIFRDIVNSLIK